MADAMLMHAFRSLSESNLTSLMLSIPYSHMAELMHDISFYTPMHHLQVVDYTPLIPL